MNVEQLALQHYALPEGGSWRGLHTEGGVWATLFGLVFWDVIFAGAVVWMLRTWCVVAHCAMVTRAQPRMFPTFRTRMPLACAEVPGVFRTPFQTCPLDMGTDAFYPARQHLLDTRLQAVADGQAGKHAWRSRYPWFYLFWSAL